LEWRKSGGKAPKVARKKKLTLEESLALLPAELLVKILLEVAAQHPLAKSALQRLAALHSRDGVDLTGLRKSIALQLTSSGKAGYKNMIELERRLEGIEKDIRQVLASGNAYGALELCEYVLEYIGKMLLTSSSPYQLGDLRKRYEAFHRELTEAARPDTAALARRLLRLIVASHYQVFPDPAASHGVLLGPQGLRDLQALLEPSAPLHLIRTIDVALGDADHFRQAIQRSLNYTRSRDFVALARIHAAQGDFAAAIRAAEEGLGRFGWDRRDLEGAIVEWLSASQGCAAALDRLFSWFAEDSSLSAYRRLREFALKSSLWPEVRQRLLDLIGSGKLSSAWAAPRIYVHLLLDEGDPSAALKVFRSTPGADRKLVLHIADGFDSANPRLAIDLRLERAREEILANGYNEALSILLEAARQAAAHDQTAYYSDRVRTLRAEHSRRTSFQRLLQDHLPELLLG
jgi:hypothetical protein